MNELHRLACSIQRQLFPAWESEVGMLSEKEQTFVRIMALTEVERFMAPYRWNWVGRKPEDRLRLAKAFIAKAVWNFPTSRALLDYLQRCPSLRRLCGWDSAGEIPSEATFSRAFAAFAAGELPQNIHAAMVGKQLGPKLVGHVSRDATAIEGREKPVPKDPKDPPAPKKRGRPRKGEAPRIKEPTRLMRQGDGPWRRIWRICRTFAMWAANATRRVIRRLGAVTNCIWTLPMGISRSVRF